MNTIKIIFTILAGYFILQGCTSRELEESTLLHKSTFIYMVADNNLDYYAGVNLKKLEENFPQDSNNDIYVYIDRSKHGNPSHPYLQRIYNDASDGTVASTILSVYKENNSCSSSVLRDVLHEVIKYCKENHSELRNIVLWSHGSGWLPEDIQYDATTRSFGLDNSDEKSNETTNEMDILELSEVFNGHHFELLLMDACFMGSIEFAYELRKSFDTLILSPSEILATSFPYDSIAGDLVSEKIIPENIARKFYNHYCQQKNALRSATVTVVRTKYLNELINCMPKIYQSFHDKLSISGLSPIYIVPQYDRSGSNIFFDFRKFIEFSMDGQTDETLNEIWDKAIPLYLHTDEIFASLDITDTSGLSIYIPNDYDKRKQLHEYYKKLSWAKDSNATVLLN